MTSNSKTTQWFIENFEPEKGRLLQVAYNKVIESTQSDFQKIDVLDTIPYGKMLTLDDVIMLTEYDHFAYHEMIVHVPMNAHPGPQRVLVVGGGDGGAITEVLKYPSVTDVVLCEIDKGVIDISKKHFKEFEAAFNDKRLKIVIDDAAKYIATMKDYFDVICVDSSDPIGQAEILFQKQFYENIKTALTEEGIAVSQSESMYYHREFIGKLFKQNQEIFPVTNYYYTIVPTYPSGTIGFSFCSKKYGPFDQVDPTRIEQVKGLRYYNESMHLSAFALPNFFKESIQ